MDGSPAHVRLILFVCGSILAGVGAFTFVVDPAHLFSDSAYEDGIARILVEGKNVANLGNYDERLVQKYFIQRTLQPPDVIVLGSSRSFQVGQGLFPGKRFFNHFVSGASLEDDLAIYETYLRWGHEPRVVIMGLDPWVLNRASGQTRWQSLRNEFNTGVQRLGLTVEGKRGGLWIQEKSKRYLELISWPYFLASVDAWSEIGRGAQGTGYHVTEERASTVAVKRADGVLVYPSSFRQKGMEGVRQAAREYASTSPIYSLGDFRRLDEEYQALFESFVQYLVRHQVEVVFFLPPYHPLVYRAIVDDPRYAMVIAAQRHFEDVARRYDIRTVGSYNPADCGLDESDFYDGMHATEDATERIFRNWR